MTMRFQLTLWTLAVTGIGASAGMVAKVASQQAPTRTTSAFTIHFLDRSQTASSGVVKEGRASQVGRSDGSTVMANLGEAGEIIVRRITLVPDRKEVYVAEPISAIAAIYNSSGHVESHLRQEFDPTCETHPELVKDPFQVIGKGTFL